MRQTDTHAEGGDVDRLVLKTTSSDVSPACGVADRGERVYWCVAFNQFDPYPAAGVLKHRPTCERCNIILDEALEGRDVRKEIQAAAVLGFESRNS